MCESEMLRVLGAKAKLKMLSKQCERETYVKEKEKFEMFLKLWELNAKAKCENMWNWKYAK